MTTLRILDSSKKFHMQQAAQLMRPGQSARKAKQHFRRVDVINLAMKIRREVAIGQRKNGRA